MRHHWNFLGKKNIRKICLRIMASISYEVNKFNPQPNAELLCAICFCVLHEPCMCPCHHIFCNSCIRKWLEHNNTCPTCRGTVNLHQLELAPPLVQNVLNDLTMDCEYKNEGCEGSISKGNFPSHIGTCDFRPVSCPHKNCSKEVTARDLSAHTKECQYRSLQCLKQCQLHLQAHELEKHDCVSALQGRVHELDEILHRHQLMLKWIRTKLNNVHLPEQSPDVQLEAYEKFLMDINHYWPEDQPIPVLLCGNYIAPSAPVTNSQSTSAANTNESVSVLEQLVAGASGDQIRPRMFGSRNSDGAESPPAHVVRDPPTRGFRYEEDVDVVGGASLGNGYYPSDETGSWDTTTDPSYPSYLSNAGDDGGASPYENSIVVHQYQSPSNSPTRGRRHRGNTQGQDRNYLLVSHSPEGSRSGFEGDQSDRTLDSTGHYSSFTNQDNYSSVSQLSATFSHQPESPSYGNVHYDEDYDRHQHDSDSADPDWDYRTSSQAHYGSHYADSPYYSRSRNRSLSPHDQNYERQGHPRSYRARIQHSPRSESSSPRSQSTENGERRYSEGFNRRHRRSRSRSCSTLRGRSSSRSPDHHQERSRSQSSSSSRSLSSSSQNIGEHLIDARGWMRTNEDRNDGSDGNRGDWTTNWDDNRRGSNIERWPDFEGELGDGMEDNENFTPILSSSHVNEHGRQTDSENTYNVLDEVVSQGQVHFLVDDTDRAQTNHSILSPTLEEVERDLLISLVHSDEFQERELNPDVSVTVIQEQERHASNSPDSGHQSHPEEHAVGHSIPSETHFQQSSSAQNNITTFENINLDSRIAEERLANDFVDGKKQETLHYLAPSCSYAQSSENGAVENAESIQGGTAIDGHQRSFNPGLSQNVWESSSNATSLDYDIPTEDLNPKPDSGSVCNSPDTGVEHVAEGISGEGDFASNLGQNCETREPHGSNSGKISPKNCDSIDSDENIPNQTKKQTGKKHQGKGKALKSNRKKKVSSVQSDTDEDSDSTVCFKRKIKVRKLLDSPSNSDVSAKETETQINLMGGDVANKADGQSNLPSTSQWSSKTMDAKKCKDKRKKKTGSEKKKDKLFSSKINANTGLLKVKLKTNSKKKKKHKSKSPPLVKKARLDHSSNYRESRTVVPDTTGRSANLEYPDSNSTISIPKSNTQRNPLVSLGHGSGSIGWTAENPKRSSRSHTFSRHELSERTDNGVEGTGLNHGPASSRGRRHSLRPVETLGKRGNERRVVASDFSQVSDSSGPRSIAACHPQRETLQTQTGGPRVMQIDSSCAPSIAAQYPERETVPTNTGGRRIMQIDGSHAPSITASPERQTARAQRGGRRRTRTESERGRIETRWHATDADRTVQIDDVPVAPSTLQLLDMAGSSDETDSTWSMGSSSTKSSSSA